MTEISSPDGFTRSMCASVCAQVREKFPKIKTSKAGVTGGYVGGVNKQFHFQFEDFHYDCRAEDAYEARAKGWSAWLEKFEKMEAA